MNDRTRAILADAHTLVRDQLAEASRQVLDERMAALATLLDEQDAEALDESRASAQRELAERLNQIARRIQASEDETQWARALVDATDPFCDRALVFTVSGGILHLAASRNVDVTELGSVPLRSAPALSAAEDSRETVIALRTAGELSEPIAGLVGQSDGEKFYIFPISARGSVTALLYADRAGGVVESNALELVASLAGAAIKERPAAKAQAAAAAASHSDGLVTIGAGPVLPASSWSALSQADRELHLKAQRFARVQVAEIRLYKSEEVKNGRAARGLYTSLRLEIDSAREVFRRDYLGTSGTMVDYLHLELLRTLANNDEQLLGSEYPGPLA